MPSTCLAIARSSILSGMDASAILRDLYDGLTDAGDDAAAECVAVLALAVEAGEVTQAEALAVLETL